MHVQRNAPVHVQKRLGPAWTGKGRPPDGSFTERTAKAAFEATLTDARRGALKARPRYHIARREKARSSA